MKSNKERILECMQLYEESITAEVGGVTTQYLSMKLQVQRPNISAILNVLVKEGNVEKVNGRPVLYRLRTKEGLEQSCFSSLIGYDQGLKRSIRLAKAAISYPGNSLHSLIYGASGVGKSDFAYRMYQYAQENGVLSKHAPFIKFNCRNYINEGEHMLNQLFTDSKNSSLQQAQGGVLFLDHVEYMSIEAREMLFRLLDHDDPSLGHHMHTIVICAFDHHDEALLQTYSAQFSILIQLPSLMQRSMHERYAFIQHFISTEALRTKRQIQVPAQVLRSLLLYECAGNIKQLKKDIQIGCATAYAREFHDKQADFSLQLEDFPLYVRKGFLQYRKYRSEIDALITDNFTYNFSEQANQEASNDVTQETTHLNIYDVIDKKSKELRNRGIAEYDINRLVSVDIENEFNEYSKQLSDTIINKEQLSKVVDSKIIALVDTFLEKATQHFDKVYPVSLFYGLCLHLASTLNNPHKVQRLSNERIMDMVDRYKSEYAFCTKFISKIEQKFQVHLPIDEVIFITMFISNDNLHSEQQSHVQVLIAMHGKGNASTMADVVNTLVKADNVYAYDLLLDMDMEHAYQELKQLIQTIDNGLGLLFLYDMGSLKNMAETIMQECHIAIRMMELPATLIAIDCARKAANEASLEQVYESVMQSTTFANDLMKETYQRSYHKQIIITLCMSGKGGAMQMKTYIEKHLAMDDIDVLPYAISDTDHLLQEVNHLRQKSHVLCVVSTYDPNLFGIPFIPISQLYETPKEELRHLLLTQPKNTNTIEVHYDEIFSFLKEQMEETFVDKIASILPKVMSAIKDDATTLSIDQELGMLLHIATALDNLCKQQPSLTNPQKKTLINRNKRLYQILKDIMKPVEQAFAVTFNDDEISYLIMNIKQ